MRKGFPIKITAKQINNTKLSEEIFAETKMIIVTKVAKLKDNMTVSLLLTIDLCG